MSFEAYETFRTHHKIFAKDRKHDFIFFSRSTQLTETSHKHAHQSKGAAVSGGWEAIVGKIFPMLQFQIDVFQSHLPIEILQ